MREESKLSEEGCERGAGRAQKEEKENEKGSDATRLTSQPHHSRIPQPSHHPPPSTNQPAPTPDPPNDSANPSSRHLPVQVLQQERDRLNREEASEGVCETEVSGWVGS